MASLPPALESLLVSQVRATRSDYRKMGLGGFFAMGAIALLCRLALDLPERNLWVIGAGAAILSLAFVIPSMFDPSKAACLDALRERAGDVVWLYERVVTGSEQRAYVLCGTQDGRFIALPAVLKDRRRVLEALAAYMPRAVVGFTPEREARFRRSPRAFLEP